MLADLGASDFVNASNIGTAHQGPSFTDLPWYTPANVPALTIFPNACTLC